MRFSLNIKTPPPAEPIPLADAKAHLRVEHTADDSIITALIIAARQACENIIQRTLVNTEYELIQDCFTPQLKLRKPPVTAIASIQYRDTTGAWQTLAPGDYSNQLSFLPGFIEPAIGKCWPATANVSDAVKVTYTAGYGANGNNVPQAIKEWMLLTIGSMYENREASTPGGASLQPFVDGLLDPFKVIEL